MKLIFYFILVSLLVFTSCKKDSNPTSPSEDASTVTYSGKVYHKVKIGNQTWLKENLDIGIMIQGTANASNNGIIEKYCYGNDTAYCRIYGGLYQWDETMSYDTTNGARGICPPGWHIPTYHEFETLKVNVNYDGNALKGIGQGTGSAAGTNVSGFSALLSGQRYSIVNNSFGTLGLYTGFWISSKFFPSQYAFDMVLDNDGNSIYMHLTSKVLGFSVRCIKD